MNEYDKIPCHFNAIHANFPRTFNFSCLNGYLGNGTFCQGKHMK